MKLYIMEIPIKLIKLYLKHVKYLITKYSVLSAFRKQASPFISTDLKASEFTPFARRHRSYIGKQQGIRNLGTSAEEEVDKVSGQE